MNQSQISEQIQGIEERVGSLSCLQKVLLSTDGSVTQILEMITGHPVRIRTLVQEIRPAAEDIAIMLDVSPGSDINFRVVELYDGSSGEVLVHAVSHTPLERLDPSFRSDLMKADIPIGKIIRKHHIESRREITCAREIYADDLLSRTFHICNHEPLLNRSYRIIHHNRPLIAIEETFPYNAFTEELRVVIDAPSRIHLCLIDLNGSLGRVDGGVGLALDAPSLLLEAARSHEYEIWGGDEAARMRAKRAAEAMLMHLGNPGGVSITLRQTVPQHVGLGSGTQVALATAAAVARLYGREIPVAAMARIVGRGGTSGIGSAAFAEGGFILDGGHSFGPGGEKQTFAPSSASAGTPPAPLIARLVFPDDWKIVLAVPDRAPGASGAMEEDIFRSCCPVPLAEVQEICHEVVMRLLPAVAGHDLDLFASSLNR
ncbi:MAG: chorismate pyruvate-lyase family protein, partial [Methanomicrobiaceae archaeon]|nr:chorismate pyruvate-lyase family protein [Methanomicrobiaceae archaeon]